MRMGREETTGRSELDPGSLRKRATDKNCQPVDSLRLDAGRLGLCKTPTFVWFFIENKRTYARDLRYFGKYLVAAKVR